MSGHIALIASLLALFTVSELQAHSYEGQAHLQALSVQKPHDPDLFIVDNQNIERATYREAGVLSYKKLVKFEYAFYLVGQHLSGRDDLDHLGLLYSDPRHRSYKLDYYLQNQELQDVYGIIDRFNLRVPIGEQRLTVGRAPIELSKSFIFRPNDIFAPANYNNLDPYHKSGVDAVQLQGPLAPLGEWKLIAVAGYEQDRAAQMDFDGTFLPPSNRYNARQSSILASYLNTFFEYSMQVTVGTYRDNYIVMGGSEGQLNDTVGLRIEGKQLISRKDQTGQVSFVLGLDYRWSESLLLIGEFFVNGEGLDRIEDTEKVSSTPYQPLAQLGRQYLGAGFTYDLTPTVKLRSIAQMNFTDSSSLVSASLAYSLSDKVDLNLGLLKGQGARTFEGQLRSEYGTYPQVVAFEALIRW